MSQLDLSARAYHRILKPAGTIEDLAEALYAPQPSEADVKLNIDLKFAGSKIHAKQSITTFMNRRSAACPITNGGETDRDSACFSWDRQFSYSVSDGPFNAPFLRLGWRNGRKQSQVT